jgi:AcrR family transcriptional regulator
LKLQIEPVSKQKKPRPGLRERKKLETRRQIAQAASGLFRKQGYDNVRMIDIAAAANVSEQTLYNYFPTKEDLVFDRDDEFEKRIIKVVTERKPGITFADVLRAGALEFLDDLSDSIGKDTGLPASVTTGPALRRVWVDLNARCADTLADALAHAIQPKPPRATRKFMARAIVAMFATILEGVGEGTLREKKRRKILKEMREAIEATTRLIENGFGR